jgi:hypothetical protein
MEYKIEISMTPSFHDYARAPYFWCILGRNERESKWFNCGHGWATTHQEAWKHAYAYYDDITST